MSASSPADAWAVGTAVSAVGSGCTLSTNGTVVATTPAPGSFGAVPVNLRLCDLPATVTVPRVTGLDDSSAQVTITNAALTVGSVTLKGDCTFDPGTVIRQTPAAGTTVSRGTAVNLTEATPPKPHGCPQ